MSSTTFGLQQVTDWGLKPGFCSFALLGGKTFFSHLYPFNILPHFLLKFYSCSFFLFSPSLFFPHVFNSQCWWPSSVCIGQPLGLAGVQGLTQSFSFPCLPCYSCACSSCLQFFWKRPQWEAWVLWHMAGISTLQLSIGAANLLQVELAVLRMCLWLSSSLALCCGLGPFWIPQCSGRAGAVPTLFLLLLYPFPGSLAFSGFLLAARVVF